MLRLISIILIVFLIGILVVKQVRKSFEKMFKQNFTPNVKDDKNEVIYSDDEVVVLKGESRKKEDN